MSLMPHRMEHKDAAIRRKGHLNFAKPAKFIFAWAVA